MKTYTVALFGEAEKGEFQTAYYCKTLPELVDLLGNPPSESQGLYYATQALLYNRELIFFRVREEGFSVPDYFEGLRWLQDRLLILPLAAICVPGMGDKEVLEAMTTLCFIHQSILITTEADFYDYLTAA